MKDPAEMKKGVFHWFEHPGDIVNVPALMFDGMYSHVTAPSLQIAGWYDQALGPMLDDFVNIHKEGAGNSRQTRIIIGPWTHGMPGVPNNKIFHQHKLDGIRIYGRDLISWYDFWLRGINNGADKDAPVKLFVMGEDKWRNENEWPLARTKWTPFYISSAGKANSIKGDGKLVMAEPKNETADKFDYDPANPAPTLGGAYLPHAQWTAGSTNQSPAE